MCRKRLGFGAISRNRAKPKLRNPSVIYFIICLLGQFGSISSACTIGAFSFGATQNHKPILWKNRDISNPDQAVYFFTDGRYRYLGLVYAGDSSRVWAGINEKGFAIINSNSGNIGPGASNGLDDGEVMKYALQNYVSIEEFRHFLDSTNKTGRRTPSNFGVLDSTGEATIFEAGGYQYERFDASKESLGFMLRANYSMSGDSTHQSGLARYLRGLELAQAGYQQGILDAPYIIDKIARDLGSPGFDPYPLPFRDTLGSYPYGFLPTTASINRYRTRACVVIVGKGLNETNNFPRMWTILGEPCAGIALPLFFAAGAVPEPMNGPGLPKICDWAKLMRDYVYVGSDFGLNTFLLAPIYEKLLPLESEIFNITQANLNRWQIETPPASEILHFEDSLAQRVVEVYQQFNRNQEDTFPIDSPGIVISPNPAHASIKFILNQESEQGLIRIYNISGRMVTQISIAPGTKLFTWTPKRLSSGIYFLSTEPNRNIKTKFHYIRN